MKTDRAFLGHFGGSGVAGGTRYTLLCAARKPLGIFGASFHACSVKAIQPKVVQVGSLQEHLHSSEVAREYIQHISLLSKCQRGGSFTMDMIDCDGFLIITNGNFYNK